MYAVYRKYTSLLPRSKAVGFDVGIDREGGCVQCIVHVIHSGVRLLPNSQSFDWGTTEPDIATATGGDRGRGGMVYNNGAIYDWQCFMPIPPT